MKKKHLFPVFFLLMLTGFPAKTRQIYVRENAVGAETGNNWADAYTSLSGALAAAPEGAEVWVAVGVYTSNTGFLIDKDLQLLGGFAGNETEAECRDPWANAVILSGDLNGDDVAGDFSLNRSDNVRNVVRVGENVTGAALIEGFVIRGGHAAGPGSPQNGGGMYCLGSPVIRQCAFEHNLALENGGAVFLESVGGEVVVFDNCRFDNNLANDGGALYSSSSRIAISRCSFSGNAANTGFTQKSGGGLYSIDSFGSIHDCFFIGNSAFDFGGGVFVEVTSSFGSQLEFIACTFENNRALTDEGGGAYFYTVGTGCRFAFSRCNFLGNKAGTWGGGLFAVDGEAANNTAFLLDSCLFYQNSNRIFGDGSALFLSLRGRETDVNITHSTFAENTTRYFATAAVWASGDSSASGNVRFDHCVFRDNTAQHSAGLDMGSLPGVGLFHYRVANCSFLNNHAQGRSGGLTVYTESPATYEVERCHFEGNTAGGQGGALWVAISDPGIDALIRGCVFKGNQSPLGGAVFAYPLFLPTTREARIAIDNSLFVDNISDNAVIAGKYTGTVRLSNSTITDNQAGSLLASDASSFELQNNILYNPGFTELEGPLEDTAVLVVSLGGNLVSDYSMERLRNATDLPAANPLLAAGYRLPPGSPAIDAGIAYDGMPDNDLAGGSRILGGCVDIGAFESPYHSGNECPVVHTREAQAEGPHLQLFPNPASSFLAVQLPVSSPQPFTVLLYDARGRLLVRQTTNDGARLNVEALPGGPYWVKAFVKGRIYAGKFIKR
ncbi:MAG: T9SS type A sorting domain-containing protein [Lewinellaceae bacterium]|nr:T9SS type A sorting domain-containing protein [Phaeodactylibacter sp.]MCB9039226.1 T9SS type A sorting domain-containing protein [Lewinellaceae bacterium]